MGADRRPCTGKDIIKSGHPLPKSSHTVSCRADSYCDLNHTTGKMMILRTDAIAS
jgi:hypothetical protein